ncbi:MAG: hypothetical protein J7L54_04945 [Elusimicrobia bacterium]|nr:hypothetical protein [Elusimicrobiota bacterium]
MKKWLYLIPFFVFLLLYGLLFLNKKRVVPDRDFYYHYHIAKFAVPEKLGSNFRLVVFRKGKVVRGIGGRYAYRFVWNGEESVASFPIPWNAPQGFYEARVFHPDEKIRSRFLPAVFAVIRRKSESVKFPLNAFTWENTRPIKNVKIRTPAGSVSGWKGIFDWVDFMGFDTLLYLAGQTAFFDRSLPRDFPWIENNLKDLDKICAEARKRKKRIGAWVASYIIIGRRDETLGYKYGVDYDVKKDTLVMKRGISICDGKRIKDIIKVLRRIDLSDVDFLGLDYIRTVSGGFELVDDFLNDMNIDFPQKLDSKEKRMIYLGRQIYRDKNYKLMDLWNWWRAHKISENIVRIKAEVGSKKPFWIFLLSWRMGHEHGQDPVMFQDAGADFETVMLYECDGRQFGNLLKQWKKYNAEKVNFVIGNQIDFPLHQFSEEPPAPEVFAERIREAKKVFKPKGIFINDLSRALWGRKGPYSTIEWLTPVKEELVK